MGASISESPEEPVQPQPLIAAWDAEASSRRQTDAEEDLLRSAPLAFEN